MLEVKFTGDPCLRVTATREKRMRAEVARTLEQGGTVNSASGWSAALAVEWCVANGRTYIVEGAVQSGHGYWCVRAGQALMEPPELGA